MHSISTGPKAIPRFKTAAASWAQLQTKHKMKFMSDKDTTAERHTCDFRKLPDDTIYGKAFNMLFVPMDEEAAWKGHILYTGREQVWIYDTVAVVQSCDQWADKIIAGRHNQEFYTALTNKSCYPLPDDEHLADLRGKVVLLDFFYKHCAPCCAALPFLQNLHEKYKDQGVVLLGIDPIDDPVKDEMADFLAKRGITYTVLFSERELSNTYHIVAFPTLFFIDHDGKIAKVHRGYHPSLEAAIEEQLLKML